ncbi:flagellar export chaperone FliS [Nocardioides dubius]|uniref:Flagellar protein FliS n=1 Tax=Nocardioides dubius TaxID=317019 RepID=A0ABN1TSR5_9ACTN
MFNDARNTYLSSSIGTASPGRLLVMLCDRMVLDIERALGLQEGAEFTDAHHHLVHAQDVVSELSSSLRVDLWEGAAALQALYSHLHTQLVQANIHRDVEATRHCLALARDLATTWRQAATATGQAVAG